MGVKERLIKFIDSKNLSQSEFERLCDLGGSLVRNNKGSISKKTLNKILRVFPDLNKEWLMEGKGVMIKSVSKEYKLHDEKIIPDKLEKITTYECPDCIHRENDFTVLKEKFRELKEKCDLQQSLIYEYKIQLGKKAGSL